MQNERYHRNAGGWTLRRGAGLRLLTALLVCTALFALAVRLMAPNRSPAMAGDPPRHDAQPNSSIQQSAPMGSSQNLSAHTAASPDAPAFVQLTREQAAQAGTLVLVNRNSAWPQGYEPPLITIADRRPKNLVGLKSTEMRADPTAFDALIELLQAARKDGVTGFLIVSSYRGYDKQKTLFDDRVQELVRDGMDLDQAQDRADDTVAWPGRSEHHTGLAFDIVSQNSDGTLQAFHQSTQYNWMKEHCNDYGFILRYPEDKISLTGIDNEPWHYRYVGVEHARAMAELGMCLEEYVAHLAENPS